ncbi:hypothetical protein [Sphaerisporangium aureirubrum]|uniref:Insertion element protein n=1 Tax=Sphaerisporangium aureirubrum TaxID=1544736 RepID=A0ABW1NU45_9ACTN
MTERAVPFHCPYCGDEDLEPFEGDGGWYCRSCVRAFKLRFLGIGRAVTTAGRAAAPPDPDFTEATPDARGEK